MLRGVDADARGRHNPLSRSGSGLPATRVRNQA